MAASPINTDAWIPEDLGGPVIAKVKQISAVESLARPVTMTTLTKEEPRDGGVSFEGATPKSTAIAKDTGTNDKILLRARKFARIIEFSEEDLADTSTVADVVQTKQLAWATSYAKGIDNACLACTGTENGTTVAFTSLYSVLTHDDDELPDPEADYTANDNVVTAASGGVTYLDLSGLFEIMETSDWWEDGQMVVIAHPTFRSVFREIKDDNDRPIFIESQSQADGNPDRLFGLPIRWTLGAKTSAVNTDKPTGKPLMFVGNKNMLVLGKRSGPEYIFAGADSGPAFEIDDAMLKVRVRRGFAVAHPRAWAMLIGL